MNTTDIAITLTQEEVLALGEAASFFLEHCQKIGLNEKRRETAHGLHSYLKKMLPHIQQKIKEGES